MHGEWASVLKEILVEKIIGHLPYDGVFTWQRGAEVIRCGSYCYRLFVGNSFEWP